MGQVRGGVRSHHCLCLLLLLLDVGEVGVAEVGCLLESHLHLYAHVVEPHDLGFVEPGAAQVHGEATEDREGEDFARSRKEVGGDGIGGDVDKGPSGEDTSELVTGIVNDGVFAQVAAHGCHDATEVFHEFVFEGQVLEVLGEGERFGDDTEEKEGRAD